MPNLDWLDLFGMCEEQTARVGNRVWRMHKKDDDPWPSSPHAVDVDTGDKLDLKKGDVYDKMKKRVEKLRRKELNRVRVDLGLRALP